jgi:hypothetical protein
MTGCVDNYPFMPRNGFFGNSNFLLRFSPALGATGCWSASASVGRIVTPADQQPVAPNLSATHAN